MTAAESFALDYAAALKGFVAEFEEEGLERAYELGRSAIEHGLGLLDLTSVHARALATDASIEPARAWRFLTAALAPFEMALRGFRDANQALRDAAENLERRVEERTSALLKTEEQVRHLQKMDAVGRLAGGVAHDFNNILSVIISLSDVEQQELEPSSPLREDLQEINKAGLRAASLTRQLLLFSRQQIFEPTVIDLQELLASMDKMLRRLIGADVELVTVTGGDHARVLADAGSLEQVVMNLVVNARDAMPNGGRLTIETSDVMVDDAFARQHVGLTVGPHVMLAVSDTGTGMDKATQGRVFEPFFTTKEKGKGTGLGLSTVFGIVRKFGGAVWLYSEPGVGTTFKVYLPRVDAPAVPVIKPAAVVSLNGSETVLLVEDD
ncbi:MAG TPA: ATP-binding protein, partial [Archangium sp.]